MRSEELELVKPEWRCEDEQKVNHARDGKANIVGHYYLHIIASRLANDSSLGPILLRPSFVNHLLKHVMCPSHPFPHCLCCV